MPTNQSSPQHPNTPDAAPAPQAPADGWGNSIDSPAAPGHATQPPMAAPAWGTAPAMADRPRRRLSPLQKGLAAAGLAVVLAGGAGAAVYAATNTGASSSNSSAVSQAQGGMGQGGMSAGGMGANGAPGMSGAGQALHGESVVRSGGQYVTEVEQTGTITAVSASSITLKSADGYSQTYTISSQTTIADLGAMSGPPQQGQSQSTLSASSLSTGQTVRLTALKDGLSAQSIMLADATGSGSGTQNG